MFGGIISLNQKAQSFRFFFQPEGNLRRAAGKQRRADFVNNPAHFLPGVGEFFAAAISSVISLGVSLILFYVFGMLDFDGKNQPSARRERTRFSAGKKAKRSA